MTDQIPDHVRSALRRRSTAPAPAVSVTSPYGPNSRAYPRPRAQWVLLYGPLVAWVLLLIGASENSPDAWVGALLMPAAVLVPAVWRVPQELRRTRARSWRLSVEEDTYAWHDPSGEWAYARWQSTLVVRLLRFLVAAMMPAAFAIAFWQQSLWVMLWLPAVIGVLVYSHRHLPTPMRPADRYRCCTACGMRRPPQAPRVCPRCGRVAELVTVAALPGLQRRLRDL